MSPRKFHPSGKTTNSHTPPDLFPEFDRYRTEAARRNYVKGVMVTLADNDALFLTDLMNLGGDILRLSHEVIMGIFVDQDSGGHHKRADIPPEIFRFQPQIRSLDGKSPIQWKGGREVAHQYAPGHGKHGTKPQPILEDYWFRTDEPEEKFMIQDAWTALKQAGKFCKFAPSRRIQGTSWTMEEVKPPGYEAFFSDEPAKPKARKPGRPRKTRAPSTSEAVV